MENIKEFLATLPDSPGCYLMKNKAGNIIYVGKAKNLKKRVSSYFNRIHNNKTQLLVNEVNNIDIMLTNNEKESLILEINLIKKHRPKYNVMFMDDKFYPYIAITKEKHPRLKVVRNTKNKNATYFGPYPNSGSAWATMKILNKLYKLRKCQSLPKKECLYYHLNQCLAPCINEVKQEEYDSIIKEIKAFLNGNIQEVITSLTTKMEAAAADLNFEMALEYKNTIEAIKETTFNQAVDKNDRKDRDYIGIYNNNDYLSIQIMLMRNGSLIERKGDLFTLVSDVKDSVISYLVQYYEFNQLPKEIYIDEQFYDEDLNELLNAHLIVPKRGNNLKLLKMANKNAEDSLRREYDLKLSNQTKIDGALKQLQELLNIPSVHRIEAFDNSTLQGSDSIGSMVVFEDGIPVKSEYRKFRIKDTDIVDDYAFMREVLYRRYHRVLVDQLKKPDLIIVDGGLGQLNIAKEIISLFNLDIKVIGLVKDDKHRTSFILDDNYQEINIDKQSQLFFLLTRIQDEVHRYAITYHRNLRSKSMFSSVIDQVPGIGSVRKEKLLKHFGSFKKLKEANLKELETILPQQVALDLYHKLEKEQK